MSNTDYQLLFLKAMQKRKWRHPLTPAQQRTIALEIRSLGEILKDAGTALSSRIHTALGMRIVSDTKAAQNKEQCQKNECGKFRSLLTKAGKETYACDACSCANKFLLSKWRDASEFCPVSINGKRFWDNRQETDVHELTPDEIKERLADG